MRHLAGRYGFELTSYEARMDKITMTLPRRLRYDDTRDDVHYLVDADGTVIITVDVVAQMSCDAHHFNVFRPATQEIVDVMRCHQFVIGTHNVAPAFAVVYFSLPSPAWTIKIDGDDGQHLKFFNAAGKFVFSLPR
jgi:hypothetical protein